MKARRVWSALLAAMMIAALAGCDSGGTSKTDSESAATGGETSSVMNETGFPIVNEPVTLKFVSYHGVAHNENFEGIEQIDRWEQETGIDLEFSTVPQTAWETQKSLIFSSGDIPDMIVGNQALTDADVSSFADQGLIIPLQDLVAKYGTNLNAILEENPHYRSKIFNADGEMWSYPALADIDFGNRGNVTFVSKKWLDEAGIEVTYDTDTYEYIDVITDSFTTDEFYDMLEKFKQIHPDTSPWIAGTGAESFLDYYASFGAYDNAQHLRLNGDTIEFSATDPNLKDGIKWVNSIFQAGFLDPETFTMDSSMYSSKVKADQGETYGVVTAWTMQQFFEMDDPRYDDWAVMLPLVGPDGIQEWPMSVPSVINGFGVITPQSEYPEICARLMDYMYSEYNSVDAMIGPLGSAAIQNEDGTYTQVPQPENVDYNEWIGSKLTGCMPFICPPSVTDRCTFNQAVTMTIEVGQTYRPFQVQKGLPGLNLTQEGNQFVADFSANAMDYIKRKHAEWITGGGIDGEWEEYVSELEKMGADQYVQYYQEAYDAVKEYLQ